MFIGRLGPITLASALALRERERRYELPRSEPSLARNDQPPTPAASSFWVSAASAPRWPWNWCAAAPRFSPSTATHDRPTLADATHPRRDRRHHRPRSAAPARRADYPRAVVGIGNDSRPASSPPRSWSTSDPATSGPRPSAANTASILERVGAHHVVLPEHDMGERVAHLVTGRMMDYIEFEDDFAMVKTAAPGRHPRQPLVDTGVRTRDGITVVGVKRPAKTSPTPRPTPSWSRGPAHRLRPH